MGEGRYLCVTVVLTKGLPCVFPLASRHNPAVTITILLLLADEETGKQGPREQPAVWSCDSQPFPVPLQPSLRGPCRAQERRLTVQRGTCLHVCRPACQALETRRVQPQD